MAKPTDKASFSKIRVIFFFALVIILSLAFIYLLRPFFYPIFWAAVIAILFYPIYKRFNALLKMPNLSSLFTIIIALVVVFVPLSLVGTLLVHQSVLLYQNVASGNILQNLEAIANWLADTPIGPVIESTRDQWATYATDAARAVTLFVFNNLKNLTQNSIQFVFLLFIMIYTLFFLFRDGVQFLKRLRFVSPLGDEHEVMLFERFTSTIRATLKSTFIVGGIQGLLGGLLFWITGVEGAIIWGVIMFLLSLVPGIGAFIIWLPAGSIMLILGHTWEGLAILIVGAAVISTIDNILRPPLVGKDIQMHPLIVLFSTLGGIFMFGISGFVIGPTLAALYLSVMSIYDHYYRDELRHNL